MTLFLVLYFTLDQIIQNKNKNSKKKKLFSNLNRAFSDNILMVCYKCKLII